MFTKLMSGISIRWRTTLFSLLLLSGLSLPLHAANATIVGEAFDLESETLLYREVHCPRDDGLMRKVIYRAENDDLIARKTLDYSTGRMTPSYVQHNFNAQPSISVAMLGDSLATVVWIDGDRANSKAVTTSLRGVKPVVVDAGFDAFVTQHWDGLRSGQMLRFHFPVVGRDDLVQLRIGKSNCTYNSDSDQCFLLEIDNWLLRAVVDPIELGYDIEQKRLVRYRGLSNIGNGEGDGLNVDIRYRYDKLAESTCS